MIGRELVYSTWYGRWQGCKKMSRLDFNNTHTYLHMYLRFCTQVRLKCCWLDGLNLDHFYNYIPTGLLSVSSSLKPLFCCFEHFCARNISKIRLRFVIWAFSTLRNQICSLKAGFTTRKTSFLPLINTIQTPADTLKVLSANDFLLNLMYLLRQYIY